MEYHFDASTVAPQQSYNPVPAGVYLAHVTDSSINPLKSGKGTGMKLTLEILDGEFKGRKVFENLNVQHENAETQSIAQSALSALCHACGVVKLTDTAMLHFKPLKIKVAVREAQGQYQASNNVKGYEAVQASGGYAPTPSAPASTVTAANVGKKPAWAK
jgi:hypothetical protein